MNNCIAIILDSVAYMKKYYEDLKEMYFHIVLILCFSHIIHGAVHKAIDICFLKIKKFSMKFASLLLKNRKAKKLFLVHLKKNNYENIKEIPRILDIRWYSFFNCIKQIKEYYPAVIDFLKDTKNETYSKLLFEFIDLDLNNLNMFYFSLNC